MRTVSRPTRARGLAARRAVAPSRQWGCGCLPALAVLTIVLCLLLVLHGALFRAAASALIENDGPHRADVAVVLGGDAFATRITEAARLAQAGFTSTVLVSGPEMYGGHESDFTIAYAVKQGFPPTLFHPIESGSDSTRSETAFLGGYLRGHQIHSVLLVTSNYHTRRAARLFRRQNPQLTVFVEPAPDPFFSPENWWKSRTGQKTFLMEWTKTVATWLGL